jgi:hypothetical protein
VTHPAPPRQDENPPVDHDAWDPCPLCGRTALPFDLRVSALLDYLGLLRETMKDVEKAAERLAS